jgi:hypothetical protein
MVQQWGSARLWPVAAAPSVARGRGRAALVLLGQKAKLGLEASRAGAAGIKGEKE